MPSSSARGWLAPLAMALATCAGHRGAQPPAPSASAAPAPPSPAIVLAEPQGLFERTVRPILARRCDPCHNPGGRMYARLPFDDAATVAGHREGVLRRLKEPEERQAVEAWLASLPPDQ